MEKPLSTEIINNYKINNIKLSYWRGVQSCITDRDKNRYIMDKHKGKGDNQ